MRKRLIIVGAAVLSTALGGVAVAGGPALDGGTGKASITVTPAEGLGPTATVQVSGSGYKPGIGVTVVQCSALRGTEQSEVTVADRTICEFDKAAQATTDADGNYGPVALEVTSTFDGTSRRGPESHSCLPQNDCQVVTSTKSGPNWAAWHHLTFTP
jgi:hypothetical protein